MWRHKNIIIIFPQFFLLQNALDATKKMQYEHHMHMWPHKYHFSQCSSFARTVIKCWQLSEHFLWNTRFLFDFPKKYMLTAFIDFHIAIESLLGRRVETGFQSHHCLLLRVYQSHSNLIGSSHKLGTGQRIWKARPILFLPAGRSKKMTFPWKKKL